jgi:hypothetical protein
MTVHIDVPCLKTPEQYRRLAREAIQKAESAPSPYFRLSYLSLASGWRALAHEAEKAFDEFIHAQAMDNFNPWPERRID